MEKVKKNDVIKVKVTGVQKYGAFVNSEDNNYDGLIHISEISYGYVKNVNDYKESPISTPLGVYGFRLVVEPSP